MKQFRKFRIYKLGPGNWELVVYYTKGPMRGLTRGHCNHVTFESAIECTDKGWNL